MKATPNAVHRPRHDYVEAALSRVSVESIQGRPLITSLRTRAVAKQARRPRAKSKLLFSFETHDLSDDILIDLAAVP